MQIKATKVALKEIQHFRDLFLAEISFQFVYDKCHRYGWADTYLFTAYGNPIGYGSVWGKDERKDFIDMYYEVNQDYRRKGVGALFVQELKKEAYRLNRVPSARCDVGNLASKATLLKAGMEVCGHILIGEL